MKTRVIYDIIMLILVFLILNFVNIPYVNTILAAIIILFYAYKTLGLKDTLGFSAQRKKIKLIATAFGMALSINFIAYFMLLNPIEYLTGKELQLGIFDQLKGNPKLYISSIIIGWFIGGFLEEIIFRGFMISKFMDLLGKKHGALVGVILSSLLFGYLHSYQGLSGQILTGITGLAFASIYLISKRNLWLTILTHGFINTISISLLYFNFIS